MPKDNQSELFYWVDENDNVLRSISRTEAHDGTKKRHRSVGVVIRNEKDEILMQKRAKTKDKYPSEWQISVAGHITFGDDALQTARRETQEEIGQTEISLEFLTKIPVEMADESEIVNVFSGEISSNTQFDIDPTEVESVLWVPKEELAQFIAENPTTTWSVQILKHIRYIQ